MAVLLTDRDMVSIVEEQRKMLQQTKYDSSCLTSKLTNPLPPGGREGRHALSPFFVTFCGFAGLRRVNLTRNSFFLIILVILYSRLVLYLPFFYVCSCSMMIFWFRLSFTSVLLSSASAQQRPVLKEFSCRKFIKKKTTSFLVEVFVLFFKLKRKKIDCFFIKNFYDIMSMEKQRIIFLIFTGGKKI